MGKLVEFQLRGLRALRGDIIPPRRLLDSRLRGNDRLGRAGEPLPKMPLTEARSEKADVSGS